MHVRYDVVFLVDQKSKLLPPNTPPNPNEAAMAMHGVYRPDMNGMGSARGSLTRALMALKSCKQDGTRLSSTYNQDM